MNRHLYKLILSALFFVVAVRISAQTDTVYLSFVDTKINCGQTKAIKMQVKNFRSIVTLSFTMKYDQSKLRLTSFNGASANAQIIANQAMSSDVSGGQTFSWSRPNSPISAPDGEFLNFNFEPVSGSGGTGGLIEFSNLPTAIQVEAVISGGGKIAVPVKVTNARFDVEDLFAPTIACPSSKFALAPLNTTSVNVSGLSPAYKDSLCGIAVLSYELSGATSGSGIGQDATGLSFNSGTTNVLYTAKDNAGNSARCQFQVIVSSKNDVTLYNNAPRVFCTDSTLTVETRVANFNDITALDFDLLFDKDVLQFKSKNLLNPAIKDIGFVSEVLAGQGLIKVSFTDVLGVSLPDNALLFSITFRKIGSAFSTSFDYSNVEVTTVPSNGFVVPTNIVSVPVVLIDTETPVLTCPKDTIVYTTAQMTNSVQMFDIQASASDNCSLQPINYTLSGATVLNNTFNINGKFFNVGVTNVSVNVQDYAQNTTSCGFKVTVLQPQMYISNKIVDCQANEVTLDLVAKDFKDIRKMNTLLNWNPDSLELLSVSYISPWESGVNVFPIQDSTSLSLNFSSAQGVSVPDNWVVAKVTFKIVVNQLGNVYKVGTALSNIEAGSNNSPIYGIGFGGLVRMLDTQGPIITDCPGNQVVRQDKCSAEVSWPTPYAADLCSKATLTASNAPINSTANIFANFKPTTFFYVFTDDFGNSSRCQFEITVLDTIAPRITSCTSTDLLLTTTSTPLVCGTAMPAGLPMPLVVENCTYTIFTNFKPGDIIPVGTSRYIITVRDNSNNEVTCERNINVVDVTPPRIDLSQVTPTPPVRLVNTEPGKCGATVSWTPPSAVDNCDGSVAVSSDIPSGSFFNLGRTKVSFTARDNTGNNAIDTVIVLVIDTEYPQFLNCPNSVKDTLIYLESNSCAASLVTPEILYTDNCMIGTQTAIVSGVPAGNSYPVGRTELLFKAGDPEATCFFGVTVADTIKPRITCPGDITLTTESNSCTASIPSLPAPILLTDNCSGNLRFESSTSQTLFSRDTTLITYRAFDSSQNSSSCSFHVFLKDKTAPVLNCPSEDLTLQAETDKSTAIAAWEEPTVTDNCDSNVKVTATHQNGFSAFPIGTTTVIYTATDKSDNTSTCSFKVTVTDNQSPKFANCPGGNVVINTINDDCEGRYSVLNKIIASDNHKITLRDSTGTLPSGIYPKGIYNIVYTVRDSSGNSTSCSFNLEVKDRKSPRKIFCPAPQSFTAASGSCDVQLNINQLSFPSFSDNCDNILINDTLRFENNGWKKGLPSNLVFSAGTTKLAVSATDLSGNSDTCFFNIVVTGNVLPILPPNCGRKDTTLLATGCTTSLAYDNPVVTYSICGGKESESYNYPSGYGFPVGNTTVIYTAKDINGNTATCSFVVKVEDKNPPLITFAKDSVIVVTSSCSAKVSWDQPSVIESPCDTGKFTLKPDPVWQSGAFFPVGTKNVTYTATDAFGNSSSKTLFVVVKDNTAPVFSKCPRDVEVSADGNVISDPDNILNSGIISSLKCDSISMAFRNSAFAASDNCDITAPLLQYSIQPGIPTKYAIGQQIVTARATDRSGNSATCSFKITVNAFAPKPNPTVSDSLLCAGDAVTLKVDSLAGINAVWFSANNFSSNQSTTVIKNVNATNSGKYYVYYQKGSCTSATDSVRFVVLSPPVVKADSIKINAGAAKSGNITDNDLLIKGLGYKVTWQQPSIPLGLFSGNENGEYQFTAGPVTGFVDVPYSICYTDCPDACLSNKVLHIEIVKPAAVACRVPNLLTPNNDGFNDVLFIDCIGTNRGANLYIYSQWGELVYSSTDYRNDWNGTWKNKPLPDGTYFFVFQLDKSQESQKGFISIFR